MPLPPPVDDSAVLEAKLAAMNRNFEVDESAEFAVRFSLAVVRHSTEHQFSASHMSAKAELHHSVSLLLEILELMPFQYTDK